MNQDIDKKIIPEYRGFFRSPIKGKEKHKRPQIYI